MLFASFKVDEMFEDREALAAVIIKELARYRAEALNEMIGRAGRQ